MPNVWDSTKEEERKHVHSTLSAFITFNNIKTKKCFYKSKQILHNDILIRGGLSTTQRKSCYKFMREIILDIPKEVIVLL